MFINFAELAGDREAVAKYTTSWTQVSTSPNRISSIL